MEWNEELKNRAKELVFGERKRKDFTAEEKNIADRYQDKILEIDGGLILRNTQAELEQEEVSRALKQSQATKKLEAPKFLFKTKLNKGLKELL